MSCKKCEANDFEVIEEIESDGYFNEDGSFELGAETDSRITKISCKKCFTEVPVDSIEDFKGIKELQG